MNWTVARVSGPAEEALTTTDAKAHLRVTHTDEDAYIANLAQAWREWLEERANITLVKTTWDYFQDEFPDSAEEPIRLPRGPVISVTSVKYTSVTSTTAQTLAATSWVSDTTSQPARIGLKDGQTWPTPILRDVNGVQVRYDAGYATSATGVPQRAKHVLRLLVGNSYVNREAAIVGQSSSKTRFAVDALVDMLDAREYQ